MSAPDPWPWLDRYPTVEISDWAREHKGHQLRRVEARDVSTGYVLILLRCDRCGCSLVIDEVVPFRP